MDVLEVGRLAGHPGAVVDDLEVDDLLRVVDDRHIASGSQKPRRRPLDLQARETRPASVCAAHEEDSGGSGGRRQPAHLEPLRS